jgi:DNA-binding transcriptional regulator of glucitol operon
MEVLIWILLLIAVMWVFQLYMAVKQSQRFSNALKEIRTEGTTTTVGMGGFRYRGGRAFVALAHKDGVVTGGKVLSGLTVFANAQPFDRVIGLKITDLAEGKGLEGEKKKVVDATQAAAKTLLEKNAQM